MKVWNKRLMNTSRKAERREVEEAEGAAPEEEDGGARLILIPGYRPRRGRRSSGTEGAHKIHGQVRSRRSRRLPAGRLLVLFIRSAGVTVERRLPPAFCESLNRK